jgi:hypothetical protein
MSNPILLDWRRIAWGRPDGAPRPFCAYCAAHLKKEQSVMLFRPDGSAARFCDGCIKKLWAQGLR